MSKWAALAAALLPGVSCAQVAGEVYEFRGRPGDPQPRYEIRQVEAVEGQLIAWVTVTGVVVNPAGRAARCVLTSITLPFSVEALRAAPTRRLSVAPPRPLRAPTIDAWRRGLRDGDAKSLSRVTVAQALTRIERLDRASVQALFGFDPYSNCPLSSAAGELAT